jgi:shikimate dehydrogenase
MFEPDGKTRVFGIFGDPVSHSLSPAMQNLAMQAAGLDAVYVPFHVTPQDLGSAVEGMRALRIGGVNVTLPHKQKIIPLLDRVDEDAALIGAVNTVVRRGAELVGFNTDGLGFIQSLREDVGFNPTGKSVLLLGAGGACRAAAVALLRSGVKRLSIVNRNRARAEQLVARISSVFPEQSIAAYGLDDPGYMDELGRVDLVVNTTSIGLQGEEISFCPLAKVKASASVYDMVYSPVQTPFINAARALGLVAADGLGMLAGQGEEAFFLWFDLRPEKGLMKNCLQHICAVSNP